MADSLAVADGVYRRACYLNMPLFFFANAWRRPAEVCATAHAHRAVVSRACGIHTCMREPWKSRRRVRAGNNCEGGQSRAVHASLHWDVARTQHASLASDLEAACAPRPSPLLGLRERMKWKCTHSLASSWMAGSSTHLAACKLSTHSLDCTLEKWLLTWWGRMHRTASALRWTAKARIDATHRRAHAARDTLYTKQTDLLCFRRWGNIHACTSAVPPSSASVCTYAPRNARSLAGTRVRRGQRNDARQKRKRARRNECVPRGEAHARERDSAVREGGCVGVGRAWKRDGRSVPRTHARYCLMRGHAWETGVEGAEDGVDDGATSGLETHQTHLRVPSSLRHLRTYADEVVRRTRALQAHAQASKPWPTNKPARMIERARTRAW